MVSYTEILNSTSLLHKRVGDGALTALFTGATNGIGLATLRAFLKHIPKPRAFIIGRDRSRFESEHNPALKAINPNAEIVFVQADLSLMKEIDRACAELKQRATATGIKFDLVCMSQGYAPLGPQRRFTTEGVDEVIALVYYGRMRLVTNLLSHKLLAPHDATVMSVLAGGLEGKVFEDDMQLLDNYSLFNLRGHYSSLTTLSLDYLAQNHQGVRFVHVFPGNVDTGFVHRVPDKRSWQWWLMAYVLHPILKLWGISPEECGERMLWTGIGKEIMQEDKEKCTSLDWDGTAKHTSALAEYRGRGELKNVIWEDCRKVVEGAASR